MSGWDRFSHAFLNIHVMRAALPEVIAGLGTTIQLALVVVATGLIAGFGLALLRSLRIRPMTWAILLFADVFRALPPLALIVLVYFGVPYTGLSLSGFASTWLSLSLVLAAFAEETWWAGLEAVPRGQWDAAHSLGLGFVAAMRHVGLPQAMRLVVPPLTNRTIAIMKGTAVASVVAVPDVLSKSMSAMSFAANPSPIILALAAYLLLFLPVVCCGRWVERRFR